MNGISMQVGLHTSTLSNAGGLAPSAVSPQALNRSAPVSSKTVLTNSDYPASPLLTTRPQRYSVQLNDQLTTLQHADSYLGQLEQRLLDYRHAATGGGRRSPDLQTQAAAVTELLDKRVVSSGGAVDRQLMPVLQGEAKVRFDAPALLHLANAPETVMFSVQDGQKKRLSALTAQTDTDTRQYALQLNNALRRIGIERVPGEATFTTSETQFAQISATLMQKGEGKAAQTVAVQAEPAQADRLRAAVASGNWGAAQPLVQSALGQLGEQRQQLAAQQEKARQLIDGMSRFPESQSAVAASAALTSTLDRASHHYDVLAEAVRGQANLSKLTVRSLLG